MWGGKERGCRKGGPGRSIPCTGFLVTFSLPDPDCTGQPLLFVLSLPHCIETFDIGNTEL